MAKNGLRTAYGMQNGAGELIGDFLCGLLFHSCVTMHLSNEVLIRNNAVALTQAAAMNQTMMMQQMQMQQMQASPMMAPMGQAVVMNPIMVAK